MKTDNGIKFSFQTYTKALEAIKKLLEENQDEITDIWFEHHNTWPGTLDITVRIKVFSAELAETQKNE